MHRYFIGRTAVSLITKKALSFLLAFILMFGLTAPFSRLSVNADTFDGAEIVSVIEPDDAAEAVVEGDASTKMDENEAETDDDEIFESETEPDEAADEDEDGGETVNYFVLFTINDDLLFLPEGAAVTDEVLLDGLYAEDENGVPVYVTIADVGGLNRANPKPREDLTPYLIIYEAAHPESGEIFTAVREAYVISNITRTSVRSGEAGITAVSDFGDSWYYMGFGWNPDQVANPNPLLSEPYVITSEPLTGFAVEMENLDDGNWGYGATPIGWGPTSGMPAFATAIPDEISTTGQRYGTRLWYATMFKKTFEMPEDFDAGDITNVFGSYVLSDGMIVFINGVEVYRYNIHPKAAWPESGTITLGEEIIFNSTKASGNSTRNPNDYTFTINSESLTVTANTAMNHVWSRAALETALKPGENVITVIQSRGQGSVGSSRPLYFDLEFFIQIGGEPPVSANLEWSINNPRDAAVSQIGAGDHVLKLGNLVFDPKNLPTHGGNLEIHYGSQAQNSTRRYVAWTDLSGAPDEVNDITFATPDNLAAGKIVRSATAYPAGTASVILPIPQALLYDEAADTYATEIYVLLTTDNVNDMQTTGGNRGAAEFARFDRILLDVFEPIEFARFITLAPGADPSKMNFAWFTLKDEARAAVLQLVKKSDLVDGKMPVSPTEFIGAQAYGAYNYDTNKVTASGLAKNTEYAYRVGDGITWSGIFTFKIYDPDEKYNVIVVSDPQISVGRERVWQNAAARAVAQADKIGGASFLMSAGDQTGYANDMAEIEGYLSPKELKGLPVMATVGNHDTSDQRPASAVYEAPLALLPLVYNWPNHNALGGDPRSTEGNLRGGGNWYMRYGNALYISANTNISDVALHEAFMDEAIASYPDAVWRIFISHQDIYGVGTHAASAGNPSGRQLAWSPFLDKYGIDLVINGHDHTYARSKFMKNNEIQKYQMPTVLDADGKGNIRPNPGTYIAPKGIQYIALASPSDYKYTAIMQDWVAYTQSPANDDKSEYSIMTIEGDSLTFTTYVIDGASEIPYDSITLRKKAKYADLQSLIPGCESVVKGDVTDASWAAFQTEIANAKAVASTASAEAVHAAYTALYNAYYAFELLTDKTELGVLISEAAATLASATEGRWEGQYPKGSKAVLQAVLDEAIEVYELRLSLQNEINAAFSALKTAYETFLASVSVTPSPWVKIHDVEAIGINTLGLIDWMDDSESFFWGTNPHERYYVHHTKEHFAAGYFTGNDFRLVDYPSSEVTSNAPRTETMYGPANAPGGRGANNGYITKTHVGEWIKYELNVKQAGSYKVELGAVNKQNAAQIIRLRDAEYNTLCTFTVPAKHAESNSWAEAPMIPADKEIYLPAGNVIVELVFLNNGVGSGNIFGYQDGADIDILTLERTGAGTPPPTEKDPSIFILPLPAQNAAGAPHRQQGWATDGLVDEHGMVANAGITVAIFKAATHLVLECATVSRPPSNPQGQLTTESSSWNQTDNIFLNAAVWKPETNEIVIEIEKLVGYAAFQNMQSHGRILVSYYNQGWDEMNIIKAYLILDPIVELLNDWVEEGGFWYYYIDGVMQTNHWEYWRSHWYYLLPDGKMAENQWVNWRGNWYYLGDGGAMAKNHWIYWGSHWYYLNAEGEIQTGWLSHKAWDMNTGWITDSARYYFNSDGVMHEGWLTLGTNRYYLHPVSGMMATGTVEIEGVECIFNEEGVLLGETPAAPTVRGRVDAPGGELLADTDFTAEIYIRDTAQSLQASASGGISGYNDSLNLAGWTLYTIRTYTTDANGFYYLSLPAGDFLIQLVFTGYDDFVSYISIVDTNRVEEMAPMVVIPDANKQMSGTVSGTLRDATNNNVISGAQIEIRRNWNNISGSALNTISTDSSGRYTEANIPYGYYTFMVRKEGYITAIMNISVDRSTVEKNYHLNPFDGSEYRIVLSWSAHPRDLDSHVWASGVHCYYGSRTHTNVRLDIDVTNGYGPETISISSLSALGGYEYVVHHYSGELTLWESNAIIRVYRGETLIKTYYVPTIGGTNERYWLVFAMNASGVITDLNRFIGYDEYSSRYGNFIVPTMEFLEELKAY